MNWLTTGNILLGLGGIALVVGLLLRFKVGRWLLAALWLMLTLGSLLSGDSHAFSDNLDIDADPQQASYYWLWGGVICLAAGISIRSLVGSK